MLRIEVSLDEWVSLSQKQLSSGYVTSLLLISVQRVPIKMAWRNKMLYSNILQELCN